MQTQYGFRDRFPANSSWSVLVVVVCVGLCLCLNIVLLLRGHRVVYLHSRWKESRNNPVSLSTYGEGSVVLLTWFCASCHKLSGTVCSDPLTEGVCGVCVASLLHWTGWSLEPQPERWMIESCTDSKAGREAGPAGPAGGGLKASGPCDLLSGYWVHSVAAGCSAGSSPAFPHWPQ